MAEWRPGRCDKCGRVRRMWGRPDDQRASFVCQQACPISGDIRLPCGGTIHMVMDPEVQAACQAAWILGMFEAMRPIVDRYFDGAQASEQ